VDGVLWKAFSAVATADLVRKSGTQSTIRINNIALNTARQALFQGELGLSNELVVKASVKTVILLADIVGGNTGAKRVSRSENERKINVLLLGIGEVIANLEKLSTTDHLIDGTDSQLGHDSPQLIGDVVEEIDHVFRLALKLLAKLRILGSYTDLKN
jgi:hypothetical protein